MTREPESRGWNVLPPRPIPWQMDTTYSSFIDFDPFEGIKKGLGPRDEPEEDDDDEDWDDDDRNVFKEPKREDNPDRLQVKALGAWFGPIVGPGRATKGVIGSGITFPGPPKPNPIQAQTCTFDNGVGERKTFPPSIGARLSYQPNRYPERLSLRSPGNLK